MQLLIYAGPGPWRDQVLETATLLAPHIASSVTLVTGGGARYADALAEAETRLSLPAHIPLERRALAGEPRDAILTVASEKPYDLVIFGRFASAFMRVFRGRRSTQLARRLGSSVLRVGESARPPRRILLASGGDRHTFATADFAAQLAAPFGGSITLLHVLSQQPIIFEPLTPSLDGEAAFFASDATEAVVLRRAAEGLRARQIDVTLRMRMGLVVDEILAELLKGDYDLLAVGTHHSGGPLDRMLLEDLTGDLLDRCPRTVLVARRMAQ